jgi:D-sedoheptulose 7-phosphate isomerase
LSSSFDGAAKDGTIRLATVLDSLRSRKAQVFLCGNGGSAANANHWANDLIYGAGKTGRGGSVRIRFPRTPPC